MLTIPAHPNPRCLVWGSLGTNRKNIKGLSWPLEHRILPIYTPKSQYGPNLPSSVPPRFHELSPTLDILLATTLGNILDSSSCMARDDMRLPRSKKIAFNISQLFHLHLSLSPNASMDPSTEVCAGISTSHVRSRTGVNKLKDKSFEAQISQLSSTMLLPGPEKWPLVQRWDSWRNSKLEWFLLIISPDTQIAVWKKSVALISWRPSLQIRLYSAWHPFTKACSSFSSPVSISWGQAMISCKDATLISPSCGIYRQTQQH